MRRKTKAVKPKKCVPGARERKKMKLFSGRHNSLEKEVDPVLECGQVNEKHSKEKETKVRRQDAGQHFSLITDTLRVYPF